MDRRRRNSTRDRATAELRTLRRLVQELETRPVCARRVRSLWKGVAERQRLAAAAAQRENQRLLDEVQCRADWIERLWALLCETKRMDLVQEARHNGRALDTAILHRLKCEGSSWDAARAAFKANGVDLDGGDDADDDHDRQTRTVEPHCGRFCLVVKRVLPFDVLATTQALWKMLTLTAVGAANGNDEANDASVATCSNVVAIERSQTTRSMKYEINPAILSGDVKPTILCHAVAQSVVAGGSAPTSGLQLFTWYSISSASYQTMTTSSNEKAWIAVTAADALSSVVSIVMEAQIDASAHSVPSIFQSMVRACECCVSEMLATTENVLMSRSVGHRADASFCEELMV